MMRSMVSLLLVAAICLWEVRLSLSLAATNTNNGNYRQRQQQRQPRREVLRQTSATAFVALTSGFVNNSRRAHAEEVPESSSTPSALDSTVSSSSSSSSSSSPVDATSASSAYSSYVVPKDKSVLVLGAGGKTGRECVESAIRNGRKCIATNRLGSFDFPTTDQLSIAAADVKSLESIRAAVQGNNVGAIVFTASASSKGGSAFSVDRDGVINAAKCCIAENIPRLVIVSSGSVSKPDSGIYKFLNLVGNGVMDAKIQGEDAVRALYADPAVLEKKLGYTIIRPGGLTTDPSLGASELELNQGDTKSGRIARADVAALCINCLDYASTFDTTFECYEKASGKSLEAVGFSNILKSTDPTTLMSGKERRGDTWEALFDGLTSDVAI